MDPSIDRANGHAGTWVEDEDRQLKDAVQTHGAKSWGTIAALVPGRTQKKCWSRWHNALDSSIDLVNRRTGIWTAFEGSKLKEAVQTHGGKDWAVISALIPGRTKKQCSNRWHHDNLGCNIVSASRRTGKWVEDEDSKLKDAVQTHGDKNWVTISALVPGRTKKQCSDRWRDTLNPSIGRANGREGKWTPVEDSKLNDAVQTHDCKNWAAIAALVPGRTRTQCRSRWQVLQRRPKQE
jgi:myb proto-oncogene protein